MEDSFEGIISDNRPGNGKTELPDSLIKLTKSKQEIQETWNSRKWVAILWNWKEKNGIFAALFGFHVKLWKKEPCHYKKAQHRHVPRLLVQILPFAARLSCFNLPRNQADSARQISFILSR